MSVLVIGNNGVIAGPAADGLSFEDAGFTTVNLRFIKRIGNPTRSYDPTPGKINAFDSFVAGQVYDIKMKAGLTVAGLYPPLPDEIEPDPDPVPAVYQFNGVDQTIDLANSASLNFPYSQPWSMGFFVKSPLNGVLRLGNSTTGNRMFDVSIEASGPDLVVSAYMENGTNGSTNYMSTTVDGDHHIAVNTFTYVVITWNGTLLKVYINGVDASVPSNAGTITALATGGTFRLGKFFTYTSVNGVQIDSFWIANVCPTSGQVNTLSIGSPVNVKVQSWFTAASVKAYLPFDNSLSDDYGGHNGTAVTPVYV